MGVQWVVKLSKLCNLRCRYCYEFESLADPTRMSPEELAKFFRHARQAAEEATGASEFVWHGGEPLAAPSGYFERLFELQEREFSGTGLEVRNTIQTNLFQLKKDSLDLLGRFDSIGVSLDLFGDLREDVQGRPAQTRILENMDRVRAAGIRFGCITVMSRPVAEKIDLVFDFFAEAGISFRLLPVYRTAFAGQHGDWSLEPEEIDRAMIQVFDRMVAEEPGIQVAPIDGYLSNLVRRYVEGREAQKYPTGEGAEALYIVDTDGRVYSNADAYAAEYAYGNIFEDDMATLRSSEGYRRTVAERAERLRICDGCEFRDACSGRYVAEATPEQRWEGADGALACPTAAAVQRHIDGWLRESGFLDVERGKLDVEALGPYLPEAVLV